MKTVACALCLALLIGMVGCSAYQSYTYSSPDGKTCLSKCENARWTCKERCGADKVCAGDCEATAKTCRDRCPAISLDEPDNRY